jgi:serine/threonine-protein kinase HipA
MANTITFFACSLGISEDNDFALLKALGGECAGALTVVETVPSTEKYEYKLLSLEKLENLASAESVFSAVSGQSGIRLSLAGAQDKLPVLLKDNKFYLPVGSAPSSHILKFPSKRFAHLPG